MSGQSEPITIDGDWFHDGKSVLGDVTKWHSMLRGISWRHDTITSQVLDLVDQKMLLGSPGKRLGAKAIYEKFRWISTRGSYLPSSVGESVFDSSIQSDSTKITPYSADFPKLENPLVFQVESKQTSNDNDDEESDVYSEAGSIADQEEALANILQNELLQDLALTTVTDFESWLPILLEEFAIRIGSQGVTIEHLSMMYVTHKHRR